MLLLSVPSSANKDNTRFHRFFPVYETYFASIRDHQCVSLYTAQQQESNSAIQSTLCTDVLSCIMENTSEAVKGNMASGLVALGLMPTILTFLGSSTSETALLSRRRPLLALLIACGSPAISPLPSFVYQDPVTSLKARDGRLLRRFLSALSPIRSISVVIVEYLLILAAIANVITASYYAGLWSISTIACTNAHSPMLWVGLTLHIHISGMLALALQAETILDTMQRGRPKTRWLERLRHEFTPCVSHEKLVLKPKDESYSFVFASWFASLATVVHLLFGTVAFSSLAFIGEFCPSNAFFCDQKNSQLMLIHGLGFSDSFKIISRMIASAVVCRAVLMFELAGMRNAMVSPIKEQPAVEDIQYVANVSKNAIPLTVSEN